jgi:hypothetical protein
MLCGPAWSPPGWPAAWGLRPDRIADVYYTTLLRYVGCTAYAHEEAALFGGDEIDACAPSGGASADLGARNR